MNAFSQWSQSHAAPKKPQRNVTERPILAPRASDVYGNNYYQNPSTVVPYNAAPISMVPAFQYPTAVPAPIMYPSNVAPFTNNAIDNGKPIDVSKIRKKDKNTSDDDTDDMSSGRKQNRKLKTERGYNTDMRDNKKAKVKENKKRKLKRNSVRSTDDEQVDSIRYYSGSSSRSGSHVESINNDSDDSDLSVDIEEAPVPDEAKKVEKTPSTRETKFMSVGDILGVIEQLNELIKAADIIINTQWKKNANEEEIEREKEAARKRQEEAKKRREEEKLRMNSLLEELAKEEVMPLWRHKLLGHNVALLPPESILKGKQLFRLVALCVLKVFVKPYLAVKKMKLARREVETEEFRKNLHFYLEPCELWIAKMIRIPMLSINQDPTLNFDPHRGVFEKQDSYDNRMLQLKVRFRSILRSLIESDMPSELLTKFFISLTNDENYFYESFLYPCELKALEFTDLGATMNMILAHEDCVVTSAARNNVEELHPFDESKGEDASKSTNGKMKTSASADEADVDLKPYARVRMLLMNFLFLRVLINRVILSPWNCGVCREPSVKRAASVIYNQRLLASILYQTLHELNPDIPMVSHKTNEEIEVKTEHAGGDIENGLMSGANSNIEKHANRVHQIGGDLDTSMASHARKVPSESVSTKVTEYKELVAVDNLDTISSKAYAYFYNITAWTSNMLQYSYRLMSSTVNDGATNENSRISHKLLNITSTHTNTNGTKTDVPLRAPYETLDSTWEYLYDMEHFGGYYSSHIKQWIMELLPELNNYFDKLVFHLIKCNRKLYTDTATNNMNAVRDDESILSDDP